MYAANFCNWSLDQCRELDKPIEAVYRIITENMTSFPTLLLYLATMASDSHVFRIIPD